MKRRPIFRERYPNPSDHRAGRRSEPLSDTDRGRGHPDSARFAATPAGCSIEFCPMPWALRPRHFCRFERARTTAPGGNTTSGFPDRPGRFEPKDQAPPEGPRDWAHVRGYSDIRKRSRSFSTRRENRELRRASASRVPTAQVASSIAYRPDSLHIRPKQVLYNLAEGEL